jgi:hypothetical protein
MRTMKKSTMLAGLLLEFSFAAFNVLGNGLQDNLRAGHSIGARKRVQTLAQLVTHPNVHLILFDRCIFPWHFSDHDATGYTILANTPYKSTRGVDVDTYCYTILYAVRVPPIGVTVATDQQGCLSETGECVMVAVNQSTPQRGVIAVQSRKWADADLVAHAADIGRCVRRCRSSGELREAFELAMKMSATPHESERALYLFYSLSKREQRAILNEWEPRKDRPARNEVISHTNSARDVRRMVVMGIDTRNVIVTDECTYAVPDELVNIQIAEGTPKHEVVEMLQAALWTVENKWKEVLDPGEWGGVFARGNIRGALKARESAQDATPATIVALNASSLAQSLEGLDLARANLLAMIEETKSGVAADSEPAHAGNESGNQSVELNAASA